MTSVNKLKKAKLAVSDTLYFAKKVAIGTVGLLFLPVFVAIALKDEIKKNNK